MPTGSKDPYALRRAALGVIRLMLENNLSLDLSVLIHEALKLHADFNKFPKETPAYLLDFIKERFNVYLKTQGIDYPIVQAVAGHDNLDNMYRLAQAITTYHTSKEGLTTIAAIQRALSILDVKADVDTHVKLDLLKVPAEKKLYEAVEMLKLDLDAMLAKVTPDYPKILKALHALAASINHFFDTVIVNDDNLDLRRNRYALLGSIQTLVSRVADFRVL
jgi:glycyl-tRNA synthetase beta chain